MNVALLIIGMCGAGVLSGVLTQKLHGEVRILKRTMDWRKFVLCAFSVVLFLTYMPYLFSLEEISNQIGITTGTQAAGITVWLVILKWLSYFSLAACIMQPFFNKKNLNDFTALFVPIVLILNGIFLKPYTIFVTNKVAFYDYRIIIYTVCLGLMACISGSALMKMIAEKDFSQIAKRIGKALLFMLIWLMGFMPMYLPKVFFGAIGEETAKFTLTHRLLMYTCVVFMFGGYIGYRNKPREEKFFFLVFLALSGFMQYFTLNAHRSGVTSLPLHLCNTAMVLMMFAYIFKWNSVFYFTYLVNVLGAFMAILLPNTGENVLTEAGTIVFWYNHTYAFVLPIFGVALGIFPRPNIKMMYKAIGAFSAYVLLATFLNGWLNNSPTLNPDGDQVDYFFLYGNFFIDKFAFAVPLKGERFIWDFYIGSMHLKIYWLYVLVIWLVFVALMFVIWGIYTILYRTSDAHKELARKAHLMRVDHAQLLKELDGRSVKEPLSPEGAHMIKFTNFSKTYAGTDKKAVENVNLEIHEGEVFGFIGHNGAGKSTTIKSLVGIQSITEGKIEVQGYDVARQPLEAKLNMGYVSDNHAVYENLTGREYISYVADLYMVSKKDKEERIEKYAKMFHLEKALDSEIKCYSHGMKQKTMVIGALIHNPKVWVLDEPLTGLDPTSAWQIKECMRQHAAAGNIVFFSSHVIEVVEKVCDRIAIISGGKICRVSSVEDIQKEGHSLEEVYLQYAQKTTKEDMEGERI